MTPTVYEIFDCVKEATTHDAKIYTLRQYDCKMLREVLYLAYAPHIKFFTTFFPPEYKPDCDAPVGWLQLFGVEMRRMYLFVKDHPVSKNLDERQKNHLLWQLLESLEPKEADVVMVMFRKQLDGVTHEYG